MDERILSDLKKEVFFAAEDEYKYFEQRLDAISHYSNSFFQKQAMIELSKRYIRALANINKNNMDEYETESLRQVYIDILIQLGVDEYIIESEVENYKSTHLDDNENIIVSSKGKK